jgi:two-component system alkaline phosphatase synthesis response regulator PhoP
MSKKTILLVDDDPGFVEAVKVVLAGAGYAVETALDGNEGGMKAAECHPDLIILDVMMPGKDGFELCSELKKDPARSDIPVIMLTAVGENIPRSRYSVSDGMSLEAEDYIPKPVMPDVLLDRIRALLK